MTNLLRNYSFHQVYEASNNDLVEDFYLPALMRATRYDRAVGYFRSSVFHLIQIAMSDFILRGGKMRLICSTSLDELDQEVIRESLPIGDQIDRVIAEEIKASLRDPMSLPVIELLATMIKLSVLDVKVAYKTDERGIFHTKVGIFRDNAGDALSFDGSANETFSAWAHNEERFRTFCTWKAGGPEQVDIDQRYFEELWDGKRPSLVVRPLSEVAKRVLEQHANPDPQAAIEKVRSLNGGRSRKVKQAPKQLQDHQVAVLGAWRKTRRGIIDHVTGGGKTITALACIREWFRTENKGSVLIIVPSDLLTQQWRNEIAAELAALDARILHAGGSRTHQQWPAHLRNYLRETNSSRPRIVIATMDTAATDKFVNLAEVGNHTLMIVDEVHKVGAPSRQRVLELHPGGRLGLSATPERYGDPEGTATIFSFFGEILQPTFTISDAQNTKPRRLVPYTYHFELVSLSADEARQYKQLTIRIGALSGQLEAESNWELKKQLNQVRIKRARILKGAEGKIEKAVRILVEHYIPEQRWLVYCDTTAQLDSLSEALAEARIPTTRYLSEMNSSKVGTLERFKKFGGVLLSVRCLDEGIDIPVITHALILASSLNPREHLQRRGRVLRAAPNKADAEIHDTLVGVEHQGGIRVFDHEISRALAFAVDARNERITRWRLEKLTREADPDWEDLEADLDEEMNYIGY